MRERKGHYRPPHVYVGNPNRDRGYTVQCPLTSNRTRNPVVGGKLKINHDDVVVYRSVCLSCDKENGQMCPNRNFEATFKKIGELEEFDWLTTLMQQACKVVELKVVHSRRYHGDCCLKHQNCILVRFDTKKRKDSSFDPKTSGPIIHDMIEKSAEDTPFSVPHVKLEWRGGPFYRFEIALWRRGEDIRIIARREKTKEEREQDADAGDEGGEQEEQ